jgi:hypothetical protein
MATPVDSAATLGREETAVSDAQSDRRQGRHDDQPRGAAEYPAPPPMPCLAAEYPIHHRTRAVLDWTTGPERAREAVMTGTLAAGGY